MNLHRTHARRTAAARAGFSTSTGARLDAALRMPSQTQPPRSRRRPDPLAAFWESEILPMLRAIPGLRPITVLREMQRRHAGFSDDLRRTLERRVRLWQALHGPERGTSSSGRNTRPVSKVCPDFTDTAELGVSDCSLTCGSSTGVLISAWRSPVGRRTRARGAGRREFRCVGRGVAERAPGPWVAHTRGASQRTVSRRRSAIWNAGRRGEDLTHAVTRHCARTTA